MEIIDRYIYAVTQQLPEKQRKDITQELKSLIEDMLEERESDGEASPEAAEKVLLELGEPKALAAKYRGYDRFLIGPVMFDPYLGTLKIVLSSIAIVFTVLFAIEAIISPADISEQLFSYFSSMLSAGAQGFVWVTVVFAWIEHRKQKVLERSDKEKKEWKPSDLPQIPKKNAQIKMSEPITGIFLTILFAAICLYAVEWLGIWRFQDGVRTVVPFLDAEAFRSYFPLIWVIAALGILKGCIRIIFRRRTFNLLMFHTVTVSLITIFLCILLSDISIWNASFVEQMLDAGLISPGGEGYSFVVSAWESIDEWTVVVVIIFAFIDVGTETYNTYRAKSAA